MERLTKVMNCDDGSKLYDFSNDIVNEYKEHSERVKLAIKKLANYEDADEQGLILRLPCKVSEHVWTIMTGMTEEDVMNSWRKTAIF